MTAEPNKPTVPSGQNTQNAAPKTDASAPAKKKRILIPVATVAVTVLLAVAFLYVILQLYAIAGRTYRTETAISYTMADSISATGVAVFDAVDVQGGGNLGYLVDDGERVTSGTVLAEQYSGDGQAALREQLVSLQKSIALLNKSQNSAGSDLSLLTSQSTSALYDLLDEIDQSDYSGIADQEQQFLLAQNRLQISTGQVSDFSQTIADLQAQNDSIQGQLGSLSTISADTNDYFISAANAGFLSMDAAAIDGLSPADFATALSAGLGAAPQDLAGRIVTGFSWRFYATCSDADAARFEGLSSVKIRVPGKQDAPLAATVVSVNVDADNHVAKIELECQNINAAVLTFGQENARIDLKTYQGIRIDRSALHIVDGVKGVYVKYGSLQRFRKITILYENDSYILVPSDGALGTDNEVRLYDEVIVQGTNLADRKLL